MCVCVNSSKASVASVCVCVSLPVKEVWPIYLSVKVKEAWNLHVSNNRKGGVACLKGCGL